MRSVTFRRTYTWLGALALGIGLMTSTVEAQSPIVIKYNHVVPENTAKGRAATLFAKLANERLAGRVKVEVYPNAQLYEEDAAFQALILGDIQISAPSMAKTGSFTKKLQVFDLPFLFDDVAAVDRFERSAKGRELLDSMASKGLKGLSFGREGMKQLQAKKPLRVPNDANGLKFRIMASDVLVAQTQAVGGFPQKLAFAEVYNALQTGVIDAHENTWSLIWSKKFFETAKYITESNHGVLDYVVVTNARFWAGLPADIRTELESIMKEVMLIQYEEAAKETAADRQKIIDTGKAEIIQLTPEQRALWRAAMRPVWQKFEKEIGKDVIEAAKNSNKSF